MTGQKGTNSIAERKEGNRKFYTNLFNFRAQRRYWSKNNNLVLSIYNKKQPAELCQEQRNLISHAKIVSGGETLDVMSDVT